MTIAILVAAKSPQADLGLATTVFRHGGCHKTPMHSKRATEFDTWRLTCSCGLELSFPQVGPAATAVSYTRTDGMTRLLPEGSFSSTVKDAIEIISLESAA